ncbi:MAG TPA: OstA-like protein [Bacteroidales bacterium]|nr:OstA-like protein [Bacteroidales bacterium]HRW94384.1 OstA-like protein [Bacteroidales bacterium]
MKRHRILLFLVTIAGCITASHHLLGQSSVQERSEDDKVHLISAKVAEMYELFGVSYRKVTGPASFLHNDTYILCDTAIWNTEQNVIHAVGNVQVIQEGTRLTGETIHYLGDLNTAEVRGRVVELIDKDENRLRTQYLNFNTKDSIGYFFNGGSIVDNEGTLLESRRGYYYSKEKLFCLYEHVEMGTDTLKIKADSLYYHTDLNLAEYWGNVQAWHTDGFLTCHEGTYEREKELFHFLDDVFIQTEEQEIYADDVHYDRLKNSGTLLKNVQVRDTTQQILVLGDCLDFRREPDWVQVTENPVFIACETDPETNRTDSLFLGSDTLRVFTTTIGQMDSTDRSRAFERREIPVRTKPLLPADSLSVADTITTVDTLVASETVKKPESVPAKKDTVSDPENELTKRMILSDSLDIQISLIKIDSSFLAGVRQEGDSLFNTMEVHLFYGYNNVKVYRNDLQSVCDSLVFNSIDSVLRQYGKPVIWNQESQLSADSVFFRFSRDSLYRVDFLSASFLISQEEEIFFHQIKGDMMQAHIRDNDIFRFDALKNVKALFYIPEDSLITSLNIKECEEMNVMLKERRAERITYKKSVKSDMIPLFELKKEQERLADFNWRAADRPIDRYSITQRSIIPSPLKTGIIYKPPLFPYTLKYFPSVHALPSTLRSGVTIDAVKELNRRESENRINPFLPLESLMDSKPEEPQPSRIRQRIPPNRRRITTILEQKKSEIQKVE